MALTYTTYVSEIATITAISSTILVSGDSNFQGIMPGIIDYAEGRLYRELNLPAAHVSNIDSVCSPGVRSCLISTTNGLILTIDDLAYYTPVGTNLNRIPMVPTSLAVIQTAYGSVASSNCGAPQYYVRAPGDHRLIFGPCPDQAYQLELNGTVRPDPLSASNPSTWLTQNLPELMIAAGMIFAAGYMRDFGAQADDPKMAQSWEAQYSALVKSAGVDSARMKGQSEAWTSQIPAPLATPPRV